MNFVDPKSAQTAVDARYRIILIIWLAMLASLGLYFLMTKFIEVSAADGDGTILWVLWALGVAITGISFLLKRALLSKAVREQRIEAVQVAYIIAFALCDAGGIFGVLAYFSTGHRYYYLLFITPVLGMLLHMPSRDDLVSASFKR
ncbi:MAG: hypothetical protein H0T92_06530 [Pyrinomonadaceae bacterium]|nr:hypothetical protein [Pyrinomonadaceae bacterium]